MCIGVPMQVVSCTSHTAVCERQGQRQSVDVSLVGPQPTGTWLLVFLGTAREVMDPAAASRTLAALEALQLAAHGAANVDHLFADLIDREPPLPEHLRAAAGEGMTGE